MGQTFNFIGQAFDFQGQPGLYFVWATLLPLASFVVLLLTGGLKQFLRGNPGNALYDLLGGDAPQKNGAYVATAAIGGAFVLCLIGAIQFFLEAGPRHKHRHELEKAELTRERETDRAR